MVAAAVVIAAILVVLVATRGNGAYRSPSGVVEAPGSWTTFGHGVDGAFNNQADAEVTPAALSRLGSPATIPSPDGSYVTGNPIASGGVLYFGTWKGTLEAADRTTGRPIWSIALQIPGSSEHPGIHGAPALYDGVLYVAATDGRVFAVSPASGAIRWVSKRVFPASAKDVIESSIAPYNGVLYFGIGGQNDAVGEWGGAAAVRASDGKVLWVTDLVKYAGYGAAVFGTPALLPSHNLLFVATGNPVFGATVPPGPTLYSDAIVALSMSSGQIAWAYQSHRTPNDLDFLAGPTLWRGPGGVPMVGAGEKDGFFYAVNVDTHRLAWKTDLIPLGSEGMVMAPAAAGADALYVGTFEMPLAVLSDHGFVTDYQPPATGRVVALSAATGRRLWDFAMPSAVPIAPVLGDGVLFADSSNGEVYGLDPATGRPMWWGNVHGEILHAEAALTLAGGQLFVPVAAPNPGVTMFTMAPAKK